MSAALWQWLDRVHTSFSYGLSLSSKPPKLDGRESFASPLCGSGWIVSIRGSSTGRPYPPSGLGRTKGTPMDPSLCGRGWDVAYTWFSHGASLSPGRRRHDRRKSGASAAVWYLVYTSFSHRVSLSPKPPRRTGGTRVYPPLCGRGRDLAHTWLSHGASLSPKQTKEGRRD